MRTRIAVDAMGGDHAPAVVVEGAVQAARQAPDRLHLLLVGRADEVNRALEGHDTAGLSIEVVDAPEVIEMGESPATAVKSKLRSSIHVGLGLNKQGAADAFASAGNTGAVMAASLFVLGRLPNVLRPTLPGFYPTVRSFAVVLDIGANVDCKPEHLVQFASMGSIYAERVLKRPEPVVGLLNVGEEPSKGNEVAKAAYRLLEQLPGIRFQGNVEGRDVMHHAADVVVCDGFVGNIILKLGESVATALVQMVDEEMKRQALDPDQKQLVLRVLAGVQKRFNYEEYGGAPLLGVDGNALIGHGSSTPRAIRRLVLRAAEVAEENIPACIASALTA